MSGRCESNVKDTNTRGIKSSGNHSVSEDASTARREKSSDVFSVAVTETFLVIEFSSDPNSPTRTEIVLPCDRVLPAAERRVNEFLVRTIIGAIR